MVVWVLTIVITILFYFKNIWFFFKDGPTQAQNIIKFSKNNPQNSVFLKLFPKICFKTQNLLGKLLGKIRLGYLWFFLKFPLRIFYFTSTPPPLSHCFLKFYLVINYNGFPYYCQFELMWYNFLFFRPFCNFPLLFLCMSLFYSV